MKKSKLILVLALLTCLSVLAPARAGDVFGSTYSATMQSAAAATGNGTAMDCGGLATVGFAVSGTFVATVTFEGTVDGVNWASLLAYNVTDGTTSATATAAGTYVCNSAGLSRVRARVSAYTSGTVTVTARGTVAHTNALAFSSGGAAGPDFSVTGANAILGTTDAHYTSIRTNGVERIYIPADGSHVNFQDAKLVNVGEPTLDSDAATKMYVDDLLPWRIDVNVYSTPTAQSGWSTINNGGGGGNLIGNAYKNSTGGGITDYIEWDVTLAAGTWTIGAITFKGTNEGIMTVKVDGSSVGTIDLYAGATAYNQIDTVAGVVVATSGKHTIRLAMATKNASSSDYVGVLQHLWLQRTL